MEICYDVEKESYSKSFTSTTNSSDIFTFKMVFIGQKQWNMCLGPNPCWGQNPVNYCLKLQHESFPYGTNQFENYTNVGREVILNNRNVYHYVGHMNEFNYSTDQYFYTNDTKNMYPGFPAGNVMISEPGWCTEIRWFDTFVSGVNDDCFTLINSCNN